MLPLCRRLALLSLLPCPPRKHRLHRCCLKLPSLSWQRCWTLVPALLLCFMRRACFLNLFDRLLLPRLLLLIYLTRWQSIGLSSYRSCHSRWAQPQTLACRCGPRCIRVASHASASNTFISCFVQAREEDMKALLFSIDAELSTAAAACLGRAEAVMNLFILLTQVLMCCLNVNVSAAARHALVLSC